jgi:hypothetical protein
MFSSILQHRFAALTRRINLQRSLGPDLRRLALRYVKLWT